MHAAITVGVGLLNAVSMGWSLDVPLEQLANVHLGWGFVAIPMFQQTPPYPIWFGRGYAAAAIAIVALWTTAELAGFTQSAAALTVYRAHMAKIAALDAPAG